MACKIIEIGKKKEQTEIEKTYHRLHSQINHIIDDAGIQPKVAWGAIFNAGIALTTVAEIIKKTYRLDL